MTDATPWDFGEPVVGYHWATPRSRGRVLLQHGYGEYAERFVEQYDRFIPALLERGLDVYAFDLPGHGRSPGRRGTVDVLAAARIHRVAKNAVAAHGPVLLFGHSLGGLITAHTMVSDPAGVVGTVLGSAALPLDAGWAVRALAGTLAAIAPYGRVLLPAAPPSTLSRRPENAELIAVDPLMHGGRLTNRTASSALRTASAVQRLAPGSPHPALIIHGTADLSTDPRGSERLAQLLTGTDVTLLTVQDGTHELLNDTDRRRTRTAIIEWLDQHSGDRPT